MVTLERNKVTEGDRGSMMQINLCISAIFYQYSGYIPPSHPHPHPPPAATAAVVVVAAVGAVAAAVAAAAAAAAVVVVHG